MKRTAFFYIHSITGLIAGVFILLLSLSGAALVFHDELDSFQKPVITSRNNTGKLITIDSCYKIIQQNYRAAQISSANISTNNKEPFSFSVYDPSYKNGTESLQIFLHPQTGAILKTRGGSKDISHNFMSWLAEFHSSFKMGKKGEWLLGVFALCFIISLLSGLIIYRRNILPALLFKSSVWRKNNIHQAIAVWTLLFNLMIAVTGFWMQRYVFKKEFYSSSTWVNTIKPSPKLLYNFDSAYQTLQQRQPDFTGYVIYFPQSVQGKTSIYGSRKSNSFIHNKKFADRISLDSAGNISTTAFVTDIPADDRYDIINAQVHYGKYGGWPIKILYALLGLSGAFLSITGFILWIKRKKRSS